MSSVDEILSNSGIHPGISNPDSEQLSHRECSSSVVWPYALLSVLEFPFCILLCYLLYVFRSLIGPYFRDSIEYMYSGRTDLRFELTYAMRVGPETISEVTVATGRSRASFELQPLGNSDDGLEVVLTE